ncbi:MAG TPA: hypothetical protein VHX63_01150 [Acidobacteriaceae bacterium]|nr:hypothetical protein [Acidobacteriaceae bacterium]
MILQHSDFRPVQGLNAKTFRSAFSSTAIDTLLIGLFSFALLPAPGRAQTSSAATDISGSWSGRNDSPKNSFMPSAISHIEAVPRQMK